MSSSTAQQVRITGIVQGVGFRPFIYTWAQMCHLSGWVLNDSQGVLVHVEGTPTDIHRFIEEIPQRAPSISKVDSCIPTTVELEQFETFEIRESTRQEGEVTLISPDVATCPDCARELFEPTDRRYHYPFINCTNCGPRFTIIDDIPYDRPTTSMRDFAMCDECTAEYADPGDRRFHAQPDACFVCGPRLYLGEKGLEGGGEYAHDSDAGANTRESTIALERERSDAIIARTATWIKTGSIVAIKGLGGYHLACDASSETAVATLRERKHRYGKPLAIMVPTVAQASTYCLVNDVEKDILSGTARPIVLLRKKLGDAPSLAHGVSGDLPELGVMLPYTPLQHLLMEQLGDTPLVMTSGNLSGEPIETEDASARKRLDHIADAFLSNDREILSRYDDSVVRVVSGEITLLRRARGYAPFPLKVPEDIANTMVLATGPEQKETFTLTREQHAFVSQHIGDLESAATMCSWESTMALYERLFRVSPQVIACDLHPEYLSSKWAREESQQAGVPLIEVQHHHAHVAAIAAEHDVREPITGIVFDGTGYGDDNTIWGGEALIADRCSYRRLAHLDTFALPGGAAAVRRPARVALALLLKHDLLQHPGAQPLLSRLRNGELSTITAMINQGLNTPLTSSMGRLFDAVASLIGIADNATYEGSPAIELEAHVDPSEQESYRFAVEQNQSDDLSQEDMQGHNGGDEQNQDGARKPFIVDHRPVLKAILDDLVEGVEARRIATKFHRAVVLLIAELADLGAAETGDRRIALGGGVFMNRFILEHAPALLTQNGLQPLTPKNLPANDGAVSYGQAVIALARYTNTAATGV